jgi:glutamate synthase (NADPH/NADH) small chain
MEFLPLQNKRVAGDTEVPELNAAGKHVVVIGGGDTGSDCIGTSNRQQAASVTNFELFPMPPDVERNPVWPYWPTRLRTSSSHEEGVQRAWSIATKQFIGEGGKLRALKTVKLEWKDGKPSEVPGSEQELPADLVLLAMGFVSPVQSMLEEFGVQKDARGQRQGRHRGRARLRHVGAEGFRRGRCAPRAIARGLGDPRRPAVRPRGRRIPHGVL